MKQKTVLVSRTGLLKDTACLCLCGERRVRHNPLSHREMWEVGGKCGVDASVQTEQI